MIPVCADDRGARMRQPGASPSCALLIVDVQTGFIIPETRHVIAGIERLIPRYAHVIATRFFNPPDSNFRRLIHWDLFDRQGPDFPLAIKLPDYAIIVDKPVYTCVTSAFLDLLRHRNVSEVHICGIDTDVCVTKCAVDLFENGLRPVVLGFACASNGGRECHEAALKILVRYIGREQVRTSVASDG